MSPHEKARHCRKGAGNQQERERYTYRALTLVTTPGGEQYRVGRTKGVTYRRYPAALGMKRRDHRAAARRVA